MIDLDSFKALLFNAHPSRQYVVALSGGRDSMVLCDLMHQLGDACTWRAIHVNHHLHEASNLWEQHANDWCDRHGAPFSVIHLDEHWEGDREHNVEARARAFRYAALTQACLPGEVLLTAHHESDQAETVLLQLLRGSGLPGLSGMPAKRTWGNTTIIRPLLSYPSAALADYALARDLHYIDDPSNACLSHRRNYLRHQVMPQLEGMWPKVAAVLARSAGHCAQAQVLLDELALMDYQQAFNAARGALDMAVLARWSLARQKNTIRYWLRLNKLPMPEQKRLEMFLSQCDVPSDRMPMIAWSHLSLRRFQGHVYWVPNLPSVDPNWEGEWDGNLALALPEPLGLIGRDDWVLGEHFGGAQSYRVRFRQGGEVFRPKGHAHHVVLKDWFQQQQLPPWVRALVPLLFDGDALVAIASPRWVMQRCRAHHPAKDVLSL